MEALSDLIATAWANPLAAPVTAMILIGFLPNMAFRAIGVLLSRGLDESSEALAFIRAIATALLAGVVGKVLASPPGALAQAPTWGRLAAMTAAIAACLLFKKSLPAALLAGLGTLALAVALR
jgi:hypothetical protein